MTVQAACVVQQKPGLKSKQKLIDAKRLCSEEMSETIIPLHVIGHVITIPDSMGQVRN